MPIEILGIECSSKVIRNLTDLVIRFYIPETVTEVMKEADYISMTLPYQWGNVFQTVGWANGYTQI